MLTNLLNRVLLTTLSRIKFSRLNIVSSSSFKRLTLNSANQLSYQPIISKYSISTSLVRNAEVKVKQQCLDLSEELKTYDAEQIMNLMTADKKHDLDPTHLAICMKRFHALYGENRCKIENDPRFEQFIWILVDQLLISAPNMSPPDIVVMVKFFQDLRYPLNHHYAVLKLCTNVIGDLTAKNIADLTETIFSIIDELKYMALGDSDEKGCIEWKLKVTNQIELMVKCLILSAGTKHHQFSNLTLKSRVDLLLACGNNLNSVNSLLSLMLKDFNDFLEHPEELIRAISALLICLSSYPTFSPPPIYSTPQMFPSFMNLKFSRYKDVLLSNNDDMKNRLLNDIRVDDEYDKLCEGFEKTLLRTNTDKSMESQKLEYESRIFLLTKLLDKTIEAFHRLVDPSQIDNWDMFLTACTEFLVSNPTNGSDHLITQCFDLIRIALNEYWKFCSDLKNLYNFSKMRYYSSNLITVVENGLIMFLEGAEEQHIDLNNFLNISRCGMDEIIATLECVMACQPSRTCFNIAFFLDELESRKHLSKHDLDFKMKFVSYMLMNKRKIQSIEPLLDELQSNLQECDSDESKINNALMFLTCVENSPEYSSYLPLINELKNKLRPNNELIDKMINKLWPGRVNRSPSAFNGYIIDLPSSDTNVDNSKRVHLTFHYDDSFWRNNDQLRPLWYLAEESLQCQGHHVVWINVSKLLQMPDAEEYLKKRVEHSIKYGCF